MVPGGRWPNRKPVSSATGAAPRRGAARSAWRGQTTKKGGFSEVDASAGLRYDFVAWESGIGGLSGLSGLVGHPSGSGLPLSGSGRFSRLQQLAAAALAGTATRVIRSGFGLLKTGTLYIIRNTQHGQVEEGLAALPACYSARASGRRRMGERGAGAGPGPVPKRGA